MSDILDVLEGRRRKPNRRANHLFTCATCGMGCAIYLRPGRPPQTHCSRACSNAQNVLTRKSPARFGAEHHAWKGDAACRKTGRTRAKRKFPTTGPCERCGTAKSERHHRDGNTLNNGLENVAFLCRKCHAADHAGGFRGKRHG